MSQPPFNRKILLVVTGLSPQVATETLYALIRPHEKVDKFIPTEMHLITTHTGAERAREHLLKKKQFKLLQEDYPDLANVQFQDSNIHVIRNSDGRPLDDIQTKEENDQAADTITDLMQRMTSQEDSALHVSISGGRKTMGFYVGYAFSLFARPQDQLSHVLVSGPFESNPDFFFPPVKPTLLRTRDGRDINTSDAKIILARIPVVRLRHGQPKSLLEGEASYIDVVDAIQKSLDPPKLVIDIKNKNILCADKPFELPPNIFAWLTWWAKLAQAGTSPISWRDLDGSEELQEKYLTIHRRVSRNAETHEATRKRFESKSEDPDAIKKIFQELNSDLKTALRNKLTDQKFADLYLPQPTGRRPHTKHGLTLSPEQINIIE